MKMFFYKNPNTLEVFAYEYKEDREKYGGKELVEMTQQEIANHLNPVLPVAEVLDAAKNELRTMRRDMLDAVTGIGFRANVAGNSDLAQEAAQVSQHLLDITDDPAINAAQTYEEMRSAGDDAFRRIAAGASQAFFATFKEFK